MLYDNRYNGKNIPVAVLDTPWGFQEFEATRFHVNQQMILLRFSALPTGHLYPTKYSWCSFRLVDYSTPRTYYGKKDYVNEKYEWHNRGGNRDLPFY